MTTGLPWEWLHPEAWVFPHARGDPLRKGNSLRRSWYPLRERAGLGDLRFHDLRHTAVLLRSAGVHPKVVQERSGRSTISITLDTYSHVLGSLRRDAADRIHEVPGDRDRRLRLLSRASHSSRGGDSSTWYYAATRARHEAYG